MTKQIKTGTKKSTPKYRVVWPDARAEHFARKTFRSADEALKACQAWWGGCFELKLLQDAQGFFMSSTGVRQPTSPYLVQG